MTTYRNKTTGETATLTLAQAIRFFDNRDMRGWDLMEDEGAADIAKLFPIKARFGETVHFVPRADYDALAAKLAEVEAERDRLEAYIEPVDDAVMAISDQLIGRDQLHEDDIELGNGNSPEDFRLSVENVLRVVRRIIDRAEAAEAALVAARNNVLASVGECLAGMSHEHASPFTRQEIKAAIERAFSTPREPTDDQ